MAEAASAVVDRIRHQVIAAPATPMTRSGAVDPDVVAKYATGLAASGAGGFAVWAHTGRGLQLPASVRDTVLTAFRAMTTLPVIVGAGVPADSQASTVEAQIAATAAMAERARALGADAIMVYPCPAFRAMPQPGNEIVTLHETVADAAGLPVLAFYLHAEAGGYAYPPDVLRILLAVPSVVGVKIATLDSAITCQDVISQVRAAGKLAVTGEDRMFGPSLMWGADAALVGIAAAAVPLSVALVDAWVRGDMPAFVTASRRLDTFAAATFHAPIDGYVQRMLWAAVWDGLIPEEHAHDRYGRPQTIVDRDRVAAVLERIRAEETCE